MNLQTNTLETKWTRIERASDLEWDLGAITNRHEAIDFLLQFKNRFCIYSPFVKKLYTSYDFIVPDESECGQITVLPDIYSYHNTIQDIPRETVEATGIHLYPGEATGGHGLVMKIPSQRRISSSRELPFSEGVRTLIMEWRDAGKLFLPVLQNGDLREYENRMPSLHLHVINLDKLRGSLSDLTLHGIRSVIADNLLEMFSVFNH